ncbi:hypothetical protein A2U01_0003580 [Trifolium medium]|uniref:Uncharacterized protein n=1 Tax=Trifolium medium TaxID=97028 RepID=A0A392M7L8_9FABA|nr:hypothetical protein [Trifolium medium]
MTRVFSKDALLEMYGGIREGDVFEQLTSLPGGGRSRSGVHSPKLMDPSQTLWVATETVTRLRSMDLKKHMRKGEPEATLNQRLDLNREVRVHEIEGYIISHLRRSPTASRRGCVSD